MTKNGYIRRSEKAYEKGLEELGKARKRKDGILARDACGKGWLAIIEATKALLISKGVKEDKLPETHRGLRYFVRKYGDKELRRIYYAVYVDLHIDGYYDGLIDYAIIAERFEDVKQYIDRVMGV